jgi:hypothetical protein
MPKNTSSYVHVFCRDCGQPMTVIQQESLDGSSLIQVTCWQQNCLLRGFTLSLERYLTLNPSELEAYRQTNRIYRPPYVRLKAIKTIPFSDLHSRLFRFVNSLEGRDRLTLKRHILSNYSERSIAILHKLNEAAGIMQHICSLNRDILQCNQNINRLRGDAISRPDIVSLEFQSRTLQQKAFLLRKQYQVLLGEIEALRQKQLEYLDKTVTEYGQMLAV